MTATPFPGENGPFGDEKLIFQGLILLEIFHDDGRKSRRNHTPILELVCVHVGSCFSSFSAEPISCLLFLVSSLLCANTYTLIANSMHLADRR